MRTPTTDKVNDWQGAVTTWEGALTSTTPAKESGMLCYNIAVAYEVLGKMELAKQWASRGYVQFNNKKARDYKNQLESREASEEKVNEQMK